MTDKRILDLFFSRSQQAVEEVRTKYGEELLRLAARVSGNRLDAEECVNDALLTAWNKIPPARPEPLLPWLYTVTRNLSLNRYRVNTAQKRGDGLFTETLEELSDVLADPDTPEAAVDRRELTQYLNRFFAHLTPRDRSLFLGRYFSGKTYPEMANALNITENTCQVRVSRLRKKLKNYLKKEGVL